ncbi:Cytochrome P450 6a2 [Melipona quadrifasciata]|uniref:Cytochrome P450 6a2 n=1 Tax=Melipona quadrifasciata TaxID=166423 RepID=A0A0M9A032_9HYME|nr:Cytochrome P450 6a2 [Melipona quadrifasciata]
MSPVFFALLVSAFSLLCLYLYLKHNYSKRNGIPTVKGCVPLVGHMLPVILKRMNFSEFIRLVHEEHKDRSMVAIYKGTRPVLIVRDPNLVKIVLQSNFSNFHENGRKVPLGVDPLLSKHPLFTYGETWSTGRKRLTYAFSNVRLKTLFAAVSEVCKKFEDFLNGRLKTSNKYEVDMKMLFPRFTGEILANGCLGIEGNCFKDEAGASAFHSLAGIIFAKSLGTINTFHYPDINRLLKFRFLPKSMDTFFRKVVRENLKIRRNDSTLGNDFFRLIIDLEETGDETDEERVMAHVVSLYLDGTETSSITLNFISHDLAANPEIQEKLRKEVRSTIEKHDGLTFEALKDMTYMNQVISESQRLRSAVGYLSKICTEEFELQGSDGLTYRIKPGMEVDISIFGLHTDPNWVNPNAFDPERFNERKQTIEKMTFLPFNVGLRRCVGMRMALFQNKTCLATLLSNYKLELSPRTQLPLKVSPYSILSESIGRNWVYISEL